MPENIQQSLFDSQRPLHSCTEQGHNFIAAGDGYYKLKANFVDTSDRDELKVFRVFICTFCAASYEKCVKDKTPVSNNGNKQEKLSIMKGPRKRVNKKCQSLNF